MNHLQNIPYRLSRTQFFAVMSKYKVESEENNKISIPYLMRKEMDIPISECQKAYDVAIEYLRSQVKVKG